MNKTVRGTQAGGRRPRVVISEAHLEHLEALAEGAYKRNPDLADRFMEELGRARIVPAAKLPKNVVTIGRRVTYLDQTTGTETTVTLSRPEDADISSGRVSILTPIGVALIGLAEGASLAWQTRGGETRRLKVLAVGEHEAAGDPLN
ncbi:nucleoside diphosphate kinase regulator [Amaricoccus tamworthensis]|uniref:nucleoside diphosphate kinase regulator n=1 Tax=Amaricoccus tamworthensis TaxID=57002 RepID=UPI003C7C88A1